MPQLKGSTPWNKGKSGYSFSKDKRLHNLTLDSLKQDIVNGLSRSGLMNKYQLSEPTIYKYRDKLPKEYKQQMYSNGRRVGAEGHRTPVYRLKMSLKKKGSKSPNKGKTYLEIFGSKEKAEIRANKTRAFMKTDRNIRKYIKKTSKGQRVLFEIVKQKYPEAVLEYPIKIDSKRTIWLDIAIPNLKINYEYDGIFWHQLPSQIERDSKRDSFLKKNGWKVIRIRSDQDLNCVVV